MRRSVRALAAVVLLPGWRSQLLPSFASRSLGPHLAL